MEASNFIVAFVAIFDFDGLVADALVLPVTKQYL